MLQQVSWGDYPVSEPFIEALESLDALRKAQ
jgi:hypothetical protein